MAILEYTMISGSDGTHRVEFGVDSSAAVSFGLSMYIEKTGQRLYDWAQSLGIGYISFIGNELWKHNSDDALRCNFYGEQKDMVVGLVFNEAAGQIKILDTIGLFTNKEWEVESITIPAAKNHPHGMYSKIPQGRFKKREGVLRAEFLRNMKTTGSTANSLQALKGEPLRGYCAYMVLRNSSTDKAVLFKVEIGSTASR